MNTPRIGVLGRIVAGEDAGRFVEVIDDTASPGGFLVFTFARPDRSGDVYDSWVESAAMVQTFFAEAGWQVD